MKLVSTVWVSTSQSKSGCYPVVLYHHFVCIDFSYIKPTDIVVHTFYLDEKHSATENPPSYLVKFEKGKKIHTFALDK